MNQFLDFLVGRFVDASVTKVRKQDEAAAGLSHRVYGIVCTPEPLRSTEDHGDTNPYQDSTFSVATLVAEIYRTALSAFTIIHHGIDSRFCPEYHLTQKYWNHCLKIKLPTMKFIPAISLLISLSLAAFANATPTPSISCPSGPSYNVFGVSGVAKSIFNAHADSGSSSSEASATSVLPNPLHIRGGELHEPESVEDVDSLVSNAAASNQLVVIDFTASW